MFKPFWGILGVLWGMLGVLWGMLGVLLSKFGVLRDIVGVLRVMLGVIRQHCRMNGLGAIHISVSMYKTTKLFQGEKRAQITLKRQNQNGLWANLILHIQFGPRA